MQNEVDMRRKELYLAEGKISPLDLVGCDTTSLCWGRENSRSCYSSLSWLLVQDISISCTSPDLLPVLVFLRGKMQRADFLTLDPVHKAAPEHALGAWGVPGLGALRIPCVQCRAVGVRNHCEIAQLAPRKLWLKRDRDTKFRNWAVGGTTPSTHCWLSQCRSSMPGQCDSALIWVYNKGKFVYLNENT